MTSTRWSEGLIVTLSTISALPIVLALVWIIVKNQASVVLLTALLATIPRQLGLLSTFRSIFQAVASFISFESKFKTLHENANLEEQELAPRVTVQQLSLNGVGFADLAEIISSIRNQSAGRFVVRGRNGAGKSTLLLKLNETLEKSFYLPAYPQFLLSEQSLSESTGESLVRYLDLAQQTDAKYLLLDEWDANLDMANLKIVNEKIEEISRSRVVVEVRHRID